MRETKRLIRSNVLGAINAISKKEHQRLSSQIAHVLFQQTYWNDAQTVAATISRFPEIDTTLILDRAWQEGKTLVVPRIDIATKHMAFYQIQDRSQLEETVYGLHEPIPSETVHTSTETIDTMIVPGVAYTENGSRMGLGGGYYDRYLTNFSGVTVSLLFSEQLVAYIPMEGHDKRINHLVSSGGVII